MIDYDNNCPICIEEFETDVCGNFINYAVTKCGHKFCLSCIVRHGKRKNLCPLCRQEFLNPIHFSPKAFDSPQSIFNDIENEEQILQRYELNYNITRSVDDEIDVENWYFGENFSERRNSIQENPMMIENTYYPDASFALYTRYRNSIFSGRTRSSSYFDYEQDVSSESDYQTTLLEPNESVDVSIDTRMRDVSNNFYDEVLSLSDSDEDGNISEDSFNDFVI
tara:strand:+ start:1521 stop:2189 length:669 start_codon:yes stop_codon:yes gene_type:complete